MASTETVRIKIAERFGFIPVDVMCNGDQFTIEPIETEQRNVFGNPTGKRIWVIGGWLHAGESRKTVRLSDESWEMREEAEMACRNGFNVSAPNKEWAPAVILDFLLSKKLAELA